MRINRKNALPRLDRRRKWLDRRNKYDESIVSGAAAPLPSIGRGLSRRTTDLIRDVGNIFKKY